MERKRSIQRSDSSIPSPLKEGEGRGSPLTRDRDQGPPSSIGVWPMQESRTAEIARSHHDTNPHSPPPLPSIAADKSLGHGEVRNPAWQHGRLGCSSRFKLWRLPRDQTPSTGPSCASLRSATHTSPRPAVAIGPHLVHVRPAMFPCALCSCQRDLAVWEQDRPGQTGVSCVTQPPLELHQWPLYWDGRLKMFQWNPPSGRHGSCPSQLPTSPCPDPD